MAEFISLINGADEKSYMKNLITYAISPVIGGYKPSSVISISNKYKNMYDLWNKYGKEYRQELCLDIFELKRKNKELILLFYKKDLLYDTLNKDENIKLLSKFGYYRDMKLMEFLKFLKIRYEVNSCPHEIGVFLGIPADDVEKFMLYDGKKFVFSGYWKVYCNKERAAQTFNNYNKSRSCVINLLKDKIGVGEICRILPGYIKNQ